MDWINKSRTLEDEIKNIVHPGKRLKKIREAKDRISDFKGEFGFRTVAKKLASTGAIKDDAGGRKVLKKFESGVISPEKDTNLVVNLLKILDVTPEFAGYIEKNKEAAQEKTSKIKKPKKSSFTGPPKNTNPLSVNIRNAIEDSPTSAYIKYYPEDFSIEIILVGDMPVPSKYKTKSTNKCRAAEVWVPGQIIKFADSDRQEIIEGEASAKI